ncbi:TolC family protein [Pinibacter aurantiacus]|uniref:TolC family protein n=1 Tax=Pinibacter aurantiacus TaxID=2851599 RepID=A0A9E2SA08_9BACT|nr:TolC family protein [Pinibacter aurantiacus]MBV4357389.1 TolC family protein [Pinibacter aurantiacus]
MREVRKFNLIAAMMLMLCVGAMAQQPTQPRQIHSFSAKEAIDYATKNNAQVKNALLDYKIQEQTNRQITAAAYPQLNGSLGTTYFPNVPVQVFPNFIAMGTYGVLTSEGVKNGSGDAIVAPADYGYIQAAFGTKWSATASATLNQILFDGQVFVGLQARQAALDYETKYAEVTTENIKVNIYKIYYQLIVSRTQVAQIDANIERTAKFLSDSKAMYDNGFVERLDVDKATVQLANLQTQKLKVERTIDNGYTGLKFLMGMPIRDSIILTDDLTDEKLRSGVLEGGDYKYEDRKEYQVLELAKELNEYNIKRYKYSYFPTANFSSTFSKNAYRDQFNIFKKGDWYTGWNIGLNISVPIFDGFAKAANIQKAKLQLEQTNNQMDNLKLSIDNDVAVSQNNFKAAIITLDYQKKNMDLAEQVYNQTKKKYEMGLSSNLEITNAQADLITAQSNYTSSLYDAVIAKIDYVKATGKLP